MTKEENRRRIRDVGIVPVVRASSPQQAIEAAEAVCAGGIPIVEVTMTVPGAIDVIAQLAKTAGKEVLIGAGTVIDADTAHRCFDAGAQFIVSPGFDLGTLKWAQEKKVLFIPGALTPTEILAAVKAGSELVKIFPCGTVGGARYIKALKGPFPDVAMVPTGGVTLDTAADFILAGAEALGIGGELVSASALQAGKTRNVTETARKFVSIVREARQKLEAKEP